MTAMSPRLTYREATVPAEKDESQSSKSSRRTDPSKESEGVYQQVLHAIFVLTRSASEAADELHAEGRKLSITDPMFEAVYRLLIDLTLVAGIVFVEESVVGELVRAFKIGPFFAGFIVTSCRVTVAVILILQIVRFARDAVIGSLLRTLLHRIHKKVQEPAITEDQVDA